MDVFKPVSSVLAAEAVAFSWDNKYALLKFFSKMPIRNYQQRRRIQ
jgi:hypothetical protein